MEYVVIGILFLLVLGGGITMLVMAQTKESSSTAGEDDGTSGATPFTGSDQTPLGDTAQHAGQQDEEGQTVTQSDAAERGGTGQQTSGPRSGGRASQGANEEPEGGRYKRDPVGGEAEGEPTAPVGEVPHPKR
jgi:hypothetical protein